MRNEEKTQQARKIEVGAARKAQNMQGVLKNEITKFLHIWAKPLQ